MGSLLLSCVVRQALDHTGQYTHVHALMPVTVGAVTLVVRECNEPCSSITRVQRFISIQHVIQICIPMNICLAPSSIRSCSFFGFRGQGLQVKLVFLEAGFANAMEDRKFRIQATLGMSDMHINFEAILVPSYISRVLLSVGEVG